LKTIISLQETESLTTEDVLEKMELIRKSLEKLYNDFQEPRSNIKRIRVEDYNNREGQKSGTGHFPDRLKAKYSILHAVEIQDLMTELLHRLKVQNLTSITMKIGDESVTYSIEEFKQLNNQLKANLTENGKEV
jgi:hypothetical protein